MSNPELSIVVPVYNVAPWLNECLDSIAAQTFTAWECILVDDGSTDFSGIICDSYARKDYRFKVIHQQNAGVSAARNKGIDFARTQLLSFVDPDDYISKNYYEALISSVSKNKADCVCSKFYMFSDRKKQYMPGNYTQSYATAGTKVFIGKREILRNFFSYATGGAWGYIFSRVLWDSVRFPVGIDLAEDLAIIPGIIAKAEIAAYVPQAAYFYRKRKRSLMSNISRERYVHSVIGSEMMLRNAIISSPDTLEPFKNAKLNNDVGRFFDYLKSRPYYEGSTLLHMVNLIQEANEVLNNGRT